MPGRALRRVKAITLAILGLALLPNDASRMGPFPERLRRDGPPRQHSSSQELSCDSAHRPSNYVNLLRVQDGATTAADGSEGMRDALRGA